METNNYSPLEAEMMSASKQEDKLSYKLVDDKATNTNAEDILAKVASVLIWVSTISFGLCFTGGLIMMIHAAASNNYSDAKYSWIGLIVIIASIIFSLINVISWAKLKVTVNISRNLFVIKGLMLEDKEKKSSKEESSDTE